MFTLASTFVVIIFINLITVLLTLSHNYYKGEFKLFWSDFTTFFKQSDNILETFLIFLICVIVSCFPFSAFLYFVGTEQFVSWKYSSNWKYGNTVFNGEYTIQQSSQNKFEVWGRRNGYYILLNTCESFNVVIEDIEKLKEQCITYNNQNSTNLTDEYSQKISNLEDIKQQFIQKFKTK